MTLTLIQDITILVHNFLRLEKTDLFLGKNNTFCMIVFMILHVVQATIKDKSMNY